MITSESGRWIEAQGSCAYANICEHCPNFRTDSGYLAVLGAQRADTLALAADAEARGWAGEADRHRQLVDRLDKLIADTSAEERWSMSRDLWFDAAHLNLPRPAHRNSPP